jgi:hypothetical protein
VKAAFEDGVAAIRGTPDYHRLRTKLLHTLARLRATRDGEARRLSIRGFAVTLGGIEKRIDFVDNDRGNLPVATRDAKLGDIRLRKGARLLRAAGRLLGVRVGMLKGY